MGRRRHRRDNHGHCWNGVILEMTRKKSNLNLNRLKQKTELLQKRKTNLKRKFIRSPKSTPIKSPYRSPLYAASPHPKKKKSHSPRVLFKDTTPTKQAQAHSWKDDESVGVADISSNEHSTEDLSPSAVQDALQSLLPSVVKNLSAEGRLDLTLLNFCQQVDENRFPLNNIALQLWAEVVKWFDCESTTTMRYSPQTKQFWKLGWRIFGGKFVNFMSGYKSHGDATLNMTNRGSYSPQSSEINFAVPDVKVLRDFDPYSVNGERKPGIYNDIISKLSANLLEQSACLTFDGKKLKQSLTTDSGDVNLLGFEKDGDIVERQNELMTKTGRIQELLDTAECNPDNESSDFCESAIPINFKDNLKVNLKQDLYDISTTNLKQMALVYPSRSLRIILLSSLLANTSNNFPLSMHIWLLTYCEKSLRLTIF